MDRQAGVLESEVTPDMIEAGATILRASVHEELHHDFGEIVTKVFLAMQDSHPISIRQFDPPKQAGF